MRQAAPEGILIAANTRFKFAMPQQGLCNKGNRSNLKQRTPALSVLPLESCAVEIAETAGDLPGVTVEKMNKQTRESGGKGIDRCN